MKLSCYILTYNSERRLAEVLLALQGIADEIVVIDSGSNDATRNVAERHDLRFIYHAFKNFTDQRQFATESCNHNWVLAVDSDEVVSPALAQRLIALKNADFITENKSEAFGIRREWYLLGRKVHCFYPSTCPDWPIRLFDRRVAFYRPGLFVHESLMGFTRSEAIEEPLLHYTCDSIHDLYGKLNQYSTLSAQTLAQNKVRPSLWRIYLFPWLVWFQWMFAKGGWRDGAVGLIHGHYIRQMVYEKYLKLHYDRSRMGHPS